MYVCGYGCCACLLLVNFTHFRVKLLQNVKKINILESTFYVPYEAITKFTGCEGDFSAFNRKCTHGRIALTYEDNAPQVRVCDHCMLEVTHRLSCDKEAAVSR
ncbi:protein FREE1-like [Rutidosis leptorrhynchoides]|uniref:protein FREE1-like n=1 Tax=Rutidosis leptorrhynchoides TaxID=125765 RepID=UPI003A99DC7C